MNIGYVQETKWKGTKAKEIEMSIKCCTQWNSCSNIRWSYEDEGDGSDQIIAVKLVILVKRVSYQSICSTSQMHRGFEKCVLAWHGWGHTRDTRNRENYNWWLFKQTYRERMTRKLKGK